VLNDEANISERLKERILRRLIIDIANLARVREAFEFTKIYPMVVRSNYNEFTNERCSLNVSRVRKPVFNLMMVLLT